MFCHSLLKSSSSAVEKVTGSNNRNSSSASYSNSTDFRVFRDVLNDLKMILRNYLITLTDKMGQ